MSDVSSTVVSVSPRLFARDPALQAAESRREAALDAELTRRFKKGDDAAFGEIIRRHRGRIFGVALNFVHNRADAEEITEDTFVRAQRGLPSFRGECSLATWLHHIATNLARNRYWYSYRRRNITGLLDAPISADSTATLADFVASDQADPLSAIDRAEFSAVVATCMKKIPAPQRDVLVLRTLCDRSYAQISQQLGINLGTVKSRIARAREKLRMEVLLMCPEFLPDFRAPTDSELRKARGEFGDLAGVPRLPTEPGHGSHPEKTRAGEDGAGELPPGK